jgi:UPF0271 protein
MARVDLNADIGESFGVYRIGDDEHLIPLLTSANVACGFHAGDPQVIDLTIGWVAQAGVALGAHPGFADLVGFGRREVSATGHEIEVSVAYQVAAVAGMGRRAGLAMQHVKPHGALYTQAWHSQPVARAVAEGVASLGLGLILVAPWDSELARAGRAAGLEVAHEGFPERGYGPDGSLLRRGTPGAVLSDPEEVAERALEMVLESATTAADGTRVQLEVDTLCIHGDNPAAVAIAQAVRSKLSAAGVTLLPIAERLRSRSAADG